MTPCREIVSTVDCHGADVVLCNGLWHTECDLTLLSLEYKSSPGVHLVLVAHI